VNGFLVDNSPEALAMTISELMNYPEIIQLTGEGARKSLYKNWETIVDEAYLRYLDVIESYQGKHPEIIENDEDPD